MFEVVIFDWDGTLADTKDFVVTAYQRVLRQNGCEVDYEFIERRMGIGPRNTLKDALRASNIPFDEEMIDSLEEEKIEIQLTLTGSVSLFEGVVDLLKSLRGRVKTALATMSNRRVVDKLLREKRVREYFNVVVTFDEVSHPKPDPEVFVKCAEKLESQPEKCVVVEDSVFGVEAAKRAGMKCIAVSSGAYTREELQEQKPDLIVNSLNKRREITNFIIGESASAR
jgi:HAD superfamily hydrolase (TIGR01509 family)